MTLPRQLTFTADNLGVDVNLMLTFNEPVEGTYKDTFPIAFKVIKFVGRGRSASLVTLGGNFVFIKPQVDRSSESNTIIADFASREINVGQVLTLNKFDHGVYVFSTPVDDEPGYFKAINGTQDKEDLALGMANPGGTYSTPLIYFGDVGFVIHRVFEGEQGTHSREDRPGVSSGIKTQFKPILRGYFTSKYEEKEIIMYEINSRPDWEVNLAELDATTTWEVARDAQTGRFRITRV